MLFSAAKVSIASGCLLRMRGSIVSLLPDVKTLTPGRQERGLRRQKTLGRRREICTVHPLHSTLGAWFGFCGIADSAIGVFGPWLADGHIAARDRAGGPGSRPQIPAGRHGRQPQLQIPRRDHAKAPEIQKSTPERRKRPNLETRPPEIRADQKTAAGSTRNIQLPTFSGSKRTPTQVQQSLSIQRPLYVQRTTAFVVAVAVSLDSAAISSELSAANFSPCSDFPALATRSDFWPLLLPADFQSACARFFSAARTHHRRWQISGALATCQKPDFFTALPHRNA